MISRRHLILGSLASLSASTLISPTFAQGNKPSYPATGQPGKVVNGYDPALVPPPEAKEDYPIDEIPRAKIKRKFRSKMVDYDGQEAPGTLIVDPYRRQLFLVMADQQAMRYGVGVGREGFAWSGDAVVGLKRRWPRWTPPPEMIERDSTAAAWPNGMPGGPGNPLGARALYLYANGVDTLYRIHGTNNPASIGKAMSSGCIRMLNQDIVDLYPRVPVGTHVVVLGE